MKIAFSVTGPDLARALAAIARQQRDAAGRTADPGPARRPHSGDTVSPEARRALAAGGEAGDDRA